MSTTRIRSRIPSSKFVSVSKLTRHRLKFQKKSKDGSSKCDAEYTGNKIHNIYGVLYDIDDLDMVNLDKAEGLGHGYVRNEVTVIDTNDNKEKAVTYLATDIDTRLKHYCWYKQHVLHGAREYRLPSVYIERIEQVECIPDPDQKRSEKELKIYLP